MCIKLAGARKSVKLRLAAFHSRLKRPGAETAPLAGATLEVMNTLPLLQTPLAESPFPGRRGQKRKAGGPVVR
jgi:hypothetical protein